MANSGEASVDLDLFGEPIQPLKDPRGRPAYAKTKENQDVVITLRAAGWSQSDIATYLQCDEKTLRKHFSRELDHGRLILDGMTLQALVAKSRQGHVGAMKEVRKFVDLQPRQPARSKEVKPVPLGKKDQLSLEAKQPASGWSNILPGIDRPN